ncbi:SWI/SNF and RSC complex subunit Ssr2 [Mycoemilia scoparia]|uniref:SWI/SNF and RSC complex subunit Ssr2 n=1 Tax=Mycoemilia scoparia TaxID=417184 RepID=A0A9W8A5H9_9FUNG|nr:SWI/SNF and RSC complex subunit Ssr2 [Mycoemilia scoparia]
MSPPPPPFDLEGKRAYYQRENVAKLYEKAVEPLTRQVEITVTEKAPQANVPDITAEFLAILTFQICQIFQEKEKVQGMQIVVPPASFFIPPKDGVSEDNSGKVLYNILRWTLEWGCEHQIYFGDKAWIAKATEDEKIQPLRQHLIDKLKSGSDAAWKQPRLFFATTEPQHQDKVSSLKEQAKNLGAEIVELSESPSHIIQYDQSKDGADVEGEANEENKGHVWFRTVYRIDNNVLVHWWYYPDSLDTWVAASGEYDTYPEPEPERNGKPWVVSQKWLVDSAKYREWANEEDYEVETSSDGSSSAPNTASASINPASDATKSLRRARHIATSRRGSPQNLSQSLPKDDGADTDDIPDHQKPKEVDIEENKQKLNYRQRAEYDPIPGGNIANIPPESAPEKETQATKASDSMDVEEKQDEKDENKDAEKKQDQDKEQKATEEDVQKKDQEMARLLPEQTQEVIIPSYSTWFNFGSIHENERKALPEFFNGRNRSKTPTIYAEYRDFMIHTYRLNPSEYLTVTACRRNLAGDVCAIMRVHAFLEQWGLINYQVDADTRPSLITAPFTGHFRVTADTPRGLQPFQPQAAPSDLDSSATKSQQDPLKSPANAVPITSGPGAAANNLAASNLALRKDIFDSDANEGSNTETPSIKVEASKSVSDISTNGRATQSGSDSNALNPLPKKEYFCFTCNVNCTKVRYHCLKASRQNLNICPQCYLSGRFPGTLSSADFIKLSSESAIQDSLVSRSAEDWSDQETLLLLEGIEMFDDDWNQIAEHVGTRTREQCILRFLQMPIEDPYEEFPEGAGGGGNLDYLKYNYIPFSKADNPVMSVVAFLAANVNPGIAAAAAKEALKQLDKAKSETKKAESDNKDSDSQAQKDNNDKMDIDDDGDTKGEHTEKTPNTAQDSASSPQNEKNGNVASATGNEKKSEFTHSKLEQAATVALAAAAIKASHLANYEEREMERMVHRIGELQLAKLELKMKQFEQMEVALEQERRSLARQRQQLLEDQFALKQKMAQINQAGQQQQQVQQSQLSASNGPSSKEPLSPQQPQSAPPVQRTATTGGSIQQQQQQTNGSLGS